MAEEETTEEESAPKEKKSSNLLMIIIIVVLILIIIIGAVVAVLLMSGDDEAVDATAAPAPQAKERSVQTETRHASARGSLSRPWSDEEEWSLKYPILLPGKGL